MSIVRSQDDGAVKRSVKTDNDRQWQRVGKQIDKDKEHE